MSKNKLRRLEKEIENKSIRGAINYMRIENGKYIAVNTNDKTGILNELEYLFEGCKINPESVFNSVEEMRAKHGANYEYNDVTKVHKEFCSQFEN